MLDIAFVNETNENIEAYEPLIEKVFLETMKQNENNQFYEISVVFVSKEKIKQINHEYRDKNQVTDVISFALFDEMNEDTILNDTSNITTLGDIFICLDKMKEQAIDYGHSQERELAFLACHGLLHLLGYDHMNPSDEELMFKRQEDILNALNIKR